jgi:hypothetical protein
VLFKLRRIAAITLWTIGAPSGWVLLLFVAIRSLLDIQHRYHWRPLSTWLPDWTDWVAIYGIFGFGTFLVAVGSLLLSILGRLPGTSKSGISSKGFPIETP